MVCNDVFYVFHATIANFDIISIENTVKFMIFWEVQLRFLTNEDFNSFSHDIKFTYEFDK